MCLDSFCPLPVYLLDFSFYKTCFLLIKKKKKKLMYISHINECISNDIIYSYIHIYVSLYEMCFDK